MPQDNIKTKDDSSPSTSNSPVKVYSTPACPWCRLLKAYLKENNIDYKDIDVSQDREAAQAMIEKSGQVGVPQIEINGKMIVGFDKEQIEQALKALNV
jgi:glutaredoxin 3